MSKFLYANTDKAVRIFSKKFGWNETFANLTIEGIQVLDNDIDTDTVNDILKCQNSTNKYSIFYVVFVKKGL